MEHTDVLMSEDLEWYAFPQDWTRRDIALELVHNLADWWWGEHPAIWVDDDDRTHGWITAGRDLFGRIRRGHIASTRPDWWVEVDEGAVGAIPCWIVKL